MTFLIKRIAKDYFLLTLDSIYVHVQFQHMFKVIKLSLSVTNQMEKKISQ